MAKAPAQRTLRLTGGTRKAADKRTSRVSQVRTKTQLQQARSELHAHTTRRLKEKTAGFQELPGMEFTRKKEAGFRSGKPGSAGVKALKARLVRTHGDGKRYVPCSYCKKRLDSHAVSGANMVTLDHISVSNKSYATRNVLPACKGCQDARGHLSIHRWIPLSKNPAHALATLQRHQATHK